MIRTLLITKIEFLCLRPLAIITIATMFKHSSMKNAFDLTFSLLCIGPLTVVFWRGTFNAITELFFRDLPTFESRWQPALILYFTGMFMKISVDLIKLAVRDTLLNKGPCLQTISSALLLYLDAFFGVVMWVGGFNFLYVFPSMYWYSLTGVLVIASIILMLLRAYHCAGGVPLNISTDEFENVFSPTNYFGTKFSSVDSYKAILDTIFIYSVVHTLVICCWWGMWELENRYILFPCEITVKDIQAWDSVIIAYFLVFVVVAFSNSGNENSLSEERIISNTVTNNFFAFLSFLAAVNYWRGMWSLLDFYFFPSMGLWNNLILSHIIGFLGSLLVGSALSLTQSSKKDSNSPEFFSCQYFSKERMCSDLDPYEHLDQPSEATPLLV